MKMQRILKVGALLGVSLSLPVAASSSLIGPVSAAQKPVVKVLADWSPVDMNTYVVGTYLNQATGYDVQYDMLPQDQSQTKLNLIMSSGANYDWVHVSKQEMFYYAQHGALKDLTPLINQYGPNIKKAISKQGWKTVTMNGKIYGIPFKDSAYVGGGILVRLDWMKKLHLKMPTTLNGLVHMLTMFKLKDPGHNGATNVPMTIVGSSPLVSDISGAFGLYNSFNLEHGKLVNQAMDPHLLPYLSFMNSLFQNGLLDNQFPTNQTATAEQKFTDGQAGAIDIGWYAIPQLLPALLKTDPHAQIAYIPPLNGPYGEGYSVGSSLYSSYVVMPNSAQDPVDAIKFANKMLSPKIFRTMYIGTKGVDYKVVHGNYYPIQPAFLNDRGYSYEYLIGAIENSYYKYWLARVRKSMDMYKGFEELNNVPNKAKHQDLLAFSTNLPTWDNDAQSLGQSLTTYAVTAIANGPTKAGLQGFQQQWESSGGDAVTKEVNDWYKSYK